jgi:putative ABC transport system permease protein
MATALVVPALVIGLPVGVGTGRLVWHEVAVGAGVGGDALVPAGWLTTIVVAALLVACVVAAAGGPARAEPVGPALRAE